MITVVLAHSLFWFDPRGPHPSPLGVRSIFAGGDTGWANLGVSALSQGRRSTISWAASWTCWASLPTWS